jgi:hypothetical protein
MEMRRGELPKQLDGRECRLYEMQKEVWRRKRGIRESDESYGSRRTGRDGMRLIEGVLEGSDELRYG